MSNAILTRTTPTPLAIGERDAAVLLSVCSKTLANWRRDKIGPPYRRIGGRILYSLDALRDYLSIDDRAEGGVQ